MQLRKPNTWGVTSTTDRHAITSSSASLFGSENDTIRNHPIQYPNLIEQFCLCRELSGCLVPKKKICSKVT
jgi:hypothetical protein